MIKKIELSISESYPHSSENKTSAKGDNHTSLVTFRVMIIRLHSAFLFFLLTSSNLLHGQIVYINQRYNIVPYNTFDYGKTILPQENNFIVHGETFNQFGQRTIVTMKIDSVGELEWIKTIGSDTEVRASGFPGSLKKINDNYFCAANRRAYTTNWVHDQGLLIKFDINFDTLWTKKYGENSVPYDTAYIFWNINMSTDNNIVISGTRAPYGLDPKVLLIKTDTSGNKLWEHVYTNLPGDVQGYSVISTTDGGYAIGAFQYYHVPPSNETGDPIVIKTDSLGNFEWVKNLGGEFSDSHVMLALSTDGNILAYYTYAVLNNPGADSYKSPQLTKLDNYGSIIWEKRYLKPKHNTYPGNLHIDTDGSIIICGKTMISYPKNTGWLMKVSSTGDSLWYRQYGLMSGIDSEHMLYDVIPTSDNGYIACGYVNPVLPDTGTQDVWVIKVDSMGCESPSYCWVGVKELPVGPRPGEIIVFPNPADEVFTINFQSPMQKGILQFVDMMGRKVEEITISRGQISAAINCSNWPLGLYVGQLTSEGRVVARCKVVIR